MIGTNESVLKMELESTHHSFIMMIFEEHNDKKHKILSGRRRRH